ncbi:MULTISPECIES: acylphosphatase [unclassified Gilliamella]|uniref:acylphosphatase n=1 Tax=unclassified Gilliamella TaxID=2685620 RepID=UPI00226A0F2C|nr:MULTISPECIES: acylphosphatase [unclassified Gilliamella]MCX8583250.1 acylphosphatase [Gilliamella sp. B3372]MCX8593556.1 acylphosphatase [Gilliamella sp. B3367]MCX8661726.1 acylphosphatase [Gilliamella sp. B2911]
MIKQVKIRVSGRVQGVGFRFFTYQQAVKLGLAGYVRNLDNGDVELVAKGDDLIISKLIQWIERGGPTSARITGIDVSEQPPQNDLTSFNVRY